MKTTLTLVVFFLSLLQGFGQPIIEWSPKEEVSLESFQSPAPNMADDRIQRYSLGASVDFNYQMANLQFVFTKNFNKYVTAYYIPENSWIETGELNDQLLKMANLDFDMLELFARQFRKRMFEKKNIGSNANFYQDQFNEANKEYAAFSATVNSEIAAAENVNEVLDKYSVDVNLQIEELAEYCKTCKPKKKKKEK